MLKNKYTLAWLLILFLFAGYVALFSWLFPYGRDEYITYGFPPAQAWENAKFFFWFLNPKAGIIIGMLLITAGKGVFVVLNSLLALWAGLGIFYFTQLRLPDFKSYKDLPLFALIMLLSLFACAAPGQSIFWLAGAMNYSWAFCVFIFFLCLLRGFYEGKIKLKDNYFTVALLFIPSLWLGLSNETGAPLALAIFGAFFILCIYKKKPLPRWFYFCWFGIALGVFYMFTAPALYNRRAYFYYDFMTLTLWQKIIAFLPRLPGFAAANLFLPLINLAAFTIYAVSRRADVLKNKNWLLGVFCFLCSCVLAGVLFMAPWAGLRMFYNASMFSIISFIFALPLINELFKFNVVKYALYLAAAFALAVLPATVVPYFHLYKQDAARRDAVKKAIAAKQVSVEIPHFIILKGPTENLGILYYDISYLEKEDLEQYLKINSRLVAPLPDNKPVRRHSVPI